MDEIGEFLAQLNAGFPHVWEMSAVDARAALAERVLPVDNIDDVQSADDLAVPSGEGGIPVRIYRPHGEAVQRPCIVYAHGGGFVFGSIESHDGFCREMARHCDAVVVSVDYRLAPEHPAPTAANDVYLVACWAADHAAELSVDPGRLLVAGDSAGGNLAAVVAVMARDRGTPSLAGQILLYPVVAPDFETESYQKYGVGYFNTAVAMRWYWEQYVPGLVMPEPVGYVVPLRAALDDLPPAVVVAAGLDPLYTEVVEYAAALRAAGVNVVLRDYAEFFHGFITVRVLRPADRPRAVLWADIRELASMPAVVPGV